MPRTLQNFSGTETGTIGSSIWICYCALVCLVFPFASMFLEQGAMSLPPRAHVPSIASLT